MSTQTGTRPPEGALHLPELETELDDQHPWPGLEGYEEGDQPFFKGREEEIEDLYRLIRRERLTLLYGKAGTGKTSLLRAGLFPKQRRQEALPVWVRLDYSPEAPALGTQVKLAVHEAAGVAELEGPEPSEDQSLWEYLHLKRGEFWNRHHRIIMPFIVFDQFEELFTHGMVEGDPDRESQIKAFMSELSDLAEDRVPASLVEDPGRRDRCNLGRHHYKLVVSIREEYLADLDRMQEYLPPALFHNRMRLTDLSADKAKEVVEQTGQAVGAAALADEIVEKASEETQEQGRKTELGVPKSAVNPALLAVLCTTLNQKRLEEGAATISRSHLQEIGSDVLAEFYRERLEELPEIPGEGRWPPGRSRSQKVNDRIAREFVDGDVRVSIPPERARTVFGDAALATLVADKILGHTPHGRIELLHDVLPDVVERSSGDFLKDWIDRVIDWVVSGLVAAAVISALLFALGFEWGKRRAPPAAAGPLYPPTVPTGPLTVGQTVALGEALVVDLNEGTRRVREAVAYMDAGDFAAAAVSLNYLSRFVADHRPIFCGDEAEAGGWEETVVRMLDHACQAVDSHAAQWRTLDDLARAGVSALSSPEWKARVVGEWEGHAQTFDSQVGAINRIVEGLRAGELPPR